tara:strand:+ start:60 stop:1358 length:1299 start_codon:yes stop_codon:yes gene_type:complete
MIVLNKKMKNKIIKYFDRLFPLNRSLTGKDYQKSLNILKEIIPLKKIDFKSGSRVFDWKIPLEWNVKNAYVLDRKKRKIIDFRKNNLHLMGYSEKVSKTINFKQLKKNLHFIKEIPNAIPYVTSYYKKRWGFCLSFNQYKKLKNQKYNVKIDSEFKKGKLSVGECLIKGKSKKEILITSYLCHPSMANNELSGPLTLSFLYNSLKKKKFKYSIRFLIAPETIGTIAYLSKFKEKIKKNVICGYVLSSCGLNKIPHYKKSKKGDSIGDIAMKAILSKKDYKILEYNPIGSDETRYGTVGINVPVGAFLRSDFDKYKEYHTSLDNKKIINFNKILENIKILTSVINFINKSDFYISKIKNCEPFLTKHHIYPTISKFNSLNKAKKITSAIMWIIANSDGKTSNIEISKKSGINLNFIDSTMRMLEKKNILKKLS